MWKRHSTERRAARGTHARVVVGMTIYFGTPRNEHISAHKAEKGTRFVGVAEISPFCWDTARTKSLFLGCDPSKCGSRLFTYAVPVPSVRLYVRSTQRSRWSNSSVRKKKIYTWVEHRSGTEKAERILEWGKVARTVRGVDMSNIAR